MLRLRYIILLAIIAVGIGTNAQQTRTLSADKANDYGLVYTLPTTALAIDVTATNTVCKKGPYAQYAKKYLGTADVISTDSSVWKFTAANIHTFGQPGQESYVMQLKPGAFTTLTVAPNGMLLAINAEADPPYDIPDLPADTPLSASSLDDNSYLKFVDEDFLVATSTAKKAELLAKKIMEVRDARLSLTRGTAETMPTDGRQLELMLASLAEQEKAMTEAFTGTTSTAVSHRRYLITPADNDFDTRQTLLRISNFDGITSPDDLAGEPVYITINVIERKQLPLDEKGEPKKMPKDALVYTVPGTAKVMISSADAPPVEKEITMAQLGYTFGLDPKLFTDKKKPATATFSPVTGALVSFDQISSAQ